MTTSRVLLKGEISINALIHNDYYMRLEQAKLHGRWFYNSLNPALKELPIDLNKIIDGNPNWSLYFDCLYGEEGYTLYKRKNTKKKYKICVDSYGMVQRKRFTVAHEIGHIVLGHFEEYSDELLSDYEEFVLDKEADMVAGEILMPYDYMLKYYNWSIQGLTYRFHVSKEAAKVRLDVLENDYMFIRDINPNRTNDSLSDEIKYIVDYFYK